MKQTFITVALFAAVFCCNHSWADALPLQERGTELRLAGEFEKAMVIQEQLLEEYDEPVGHIFAINTIVTHLSWDETNTAYDDALISHAESIFKWAEDNAQHRYAEYYSGQAHFALSFHHGAKGNYYRAGKHGTAGIRDLEAALEQEPDLADAKMHLGVAYYVADNLPPFIRMFSNLLWFVPSGNSEKSLPYLRDVIENGQQYSDVARYIYATLLLEVPETREEAESELRFLVDKYPTNPRFQLRLISLLLMQEKFEDTLLVASRYIEQEPKPVEPEFSLARIWMVRAHMGLANSAEAQRLFDETDPVFQAYAERLPGWGIAWHKLTDGQLHDVANKRDKAQDIYREILKIARSTYVNTVILEAAKQGMKSPYRLPGS